MSQELNGTRVAVLAAKGVEKAELVQPRTALDEAGASTTLLSVPDGVSDGVVQSVHDDLVLDDTFPVDAMVADVSADDFDALLLPGGALNPDTLRQDPDAVAFVRAVVTAGKPVGVICHGSWTLVEADVVRGRTLTSYPSVRTDLRNAGATVVDEEVVVDGSLVSSRDPGDLPAFCAKIVEVFAAGPVR